MLSIVESHNRQIKSLAAQNKCLIAALIEQGMNILEFENSLQESEDNKITANKKNPVSQLLVA